LIKALNVLKTLNTLKSIVKTGEGSDLRGCSLMTV
jgi:hypothetical protein